MTGRQTRSIETEAAIRECAERGLSPAEAAREVGVTAACVSRHARDYDIVFIKKRKHDDAIRALAADGKTRKEMVEILGVAATTICQRIAEMGLQVDRHRVERNSGSASRAEAMASMYKAGKTLNDIGGIYGITRERVRQIIKREHGLTKVDGGQTVSAARTRAARVSSRDLKYMEKLGCGWDEYVRIRAAGKDLMEQGVSRERTPMGAYVTQRTNARRRGIDWSISFWEWWQVWQDSGRWNERGRGKRYMMCRFADAGGYSVGNVYIATGVHNGKLQPNNPYRRSHPAFVKASVQWRLNISESNRNKPGGAHRRYLGLPTGVTVHKASGRFQAQINLGGRNVYLCMFGTAEEASAAFQKAAAQRDATQEAA